MAFKGFNHDGGSGFGSATSSPAAWSRRHGSSGGSGGGRPAARSCSRSLASSANHFRYVASNTGRLSPFAPLDE
jgi:hypothetical protein